jgi:hypothetical protein
VVIIQPEQHCVDHDHALYELRMCIPSLCARCSCIIELQPQVMFLTRCPHVPSCALLQITTTAPVRTDFYVYRTDKERIFFEVLLYLCIIYLVWSQVGTCGCRGSCCGCSPDSSTLCLRAECQPWLRGFCWSLYVQSSSTWTGLCHKILQAAVLQLIDQLHQPASDRC